MDDCLSASEVLKLANISRATLTRWMDHDWAEKKGLPSPFPAGEMRDGRAKEWKRTAVEQWLEANAKRLGRHRSEAPRALSEYKSIPLSFEKAMRAAERASKELEIPFDVSAELASIEEKLAKTLRGKGVKKTQWNGGAFDFSFGTSKSAEDHRVLFLLSYS